MKTTRLSALLVFAVITTVYTIGKADGHKTQEKTKATEKKCTIGDCCKKTSRAAMLKAKPAVKKT